MPSLYDNIKKYENTSLNALYFENKSVSYKKLIINIKKMISYFIKHGINKNDVVTLVLPNIPISIYCLYALNAMGVKINIVHPLSTYKSIIESMKKTNSKYAIVLATSFESIKKNNYTDFTFFFTNPLFDKNMLSRHIFYLKYPHIKENNKYKLIDNYIKEKACENNFECTDNDDCIYLHSGGTTGTPKTIALSNNAINNLVNKVKSSIIFDNIQGESMLAVLPMFHGFGLAMGIHAPLSNGASCALMMKFNQNKTIKWINQNKISLMIGVPVLYQKLYENEKFKNSKLTNLKFCFVGGDNVNVSLISKFNELMKQKNSNCMLLEGYGLTETVTVCSVNTKKDFKLSSVGKPLKGITFKVLDESLNELKVNEIGELYISGDTLMNSYLNDIVETTNTIISIDNKKWIKTGDLAYIDEEGFIYLKGRIKRMFKVSGINVYPSEVEKLAMQIDDVFDASLEYNNNHLVLFVIKNKSSNKSEDEIITNIYNILNENLLKYSIPKKIIIINEFPKTNVGKIDHKALSKKENG